MTELIITRGIPASGKSTWAKAWVAEHPEGRARVNRDDIREMIGITGGIGTPAQEAMVTEIEHSAIRSFLQKDVSVVSDSTNLNSKSLRQKMWLGSDEGAEISFKDFPIDLNVAIERDAQRNRVVGETVIRDMYRRYIRKGQLPRIPEVVNTLASYEFKPYVPNNDLPKAILVDTDGTVAQMNGRGPYETGKYHTDEPIQNVIDLVKMIHSTGVYVIGLSGRNEDFRDVTQSWWETHGIPYDEFHMRASGDSRNDAIVKSELFDKYIEPHYNVIGVIDDRLRVCQMWHKRGITVYRVGDPDAVF